MLIEFRVENHRSIRDEQVLTMEAGRVGEITDTRPRRVSGYPESLLPVAVLYGANASGKSNILAALGFMRDAVLGSHRSWSPDEGVPRDPFAWGPKKDEPSLFEAVILIDDVRYQYGFLVDDECFLEEWLYAWPLGKKQIWFERDRNVYKFGEHLKGENKLIEEVTRSNALFVSAAAQLNHLQLKKIYAWFRSLMSINLTSSSNRHFSRGMPSQFLLARILLDSSTPDIRQTPLFADGPSIESTMERFRSLLKNADIGIVDLKVDRGDSSESPRQPKVPKLHRFLLKHQIESDDSWLPLEEESRGTQTLFRIALPILQVIQEGGILIVDELEASLHPKLAQQIIYQFNDPVNNPRNAQLIFTTHDTNLLGTTLGDPVLRRDQVWFTEKSPEGATVLYPLTDFKPRKAENIERGYLQGRYGAIPFLGDFTVTPE